MNKLMILAILVTYKAFNDKSLTVVVNEDNHEYVVNDAIIDSIDSIDGDTISVLLVLMVMFIVKLFMSMI